MPSRLTQAFIALFALMWPTTAFPRDGVAAITLPNDIVVRIPVRSWRALRDDRVTRQALDYSCGSAAIATILTEYYGYPVSERQVLKAIDRGTLRANFETMQQGIERFGFRAVGVATSFRELSELRMPVIVYVRVRKSDHFSVLRGINGNTVLLADPSLGNRTFSARQFRAMWETRGHPAAGTFLAILPSTAQVRISAGFFVSNPRRQTGSATRNQIVASGF